MNVNTPFKNIDMTLMFLITEILTELNFNLILIGQLQDFQTDLLKLYTNI